MPAGSVLVTWPSCPASLRPPPAQATSGQDLRRSFDRRAATPGGCRPDSGRQGRFRPIEARTASAWVVVSTTPAPLTERRGHIHQHRRPCGKAGLPDSVMARRLARYTWSSRREAQAMVFTDPHASAPQGTSCPLFRCRRTPVSPRNAWTRRPRLANRADPRRCPAAPTSGCTWLLRSVYARKARQARLIEVHARHAHSVHYYARIEAHCGMQFRTNRPVPRFPAPARTDHCRSPGHARQFLP